MVDPKADVEFERGGEASMSYEDMADMLWEDTRDKKSTKEKTVPDASASVDNNNLSNIYEQGGSTMNKANTQTPETEVDQDQKLVDDLLSAEVSAAEAAVNPNPNAEPYVPVLERQPDAASSRTPAAAVEPDDIPKTLKGLTADKIAKLNFRAEDINSPDKVYSALKGVGVHMSPHQKKAFEENLAQCDGNTDKYNRVCSQQIKAGMEFGVANKIRPRVGHVPDVTNVTQDGKPYNYDNAFKVIAKGDYTVGSVGRGAIDMNGHQEVVSRVKLHVSVPDHVYNTIRDAEGQFVKGEKLALGSPEAQAALDAKTGRVVDRILRDPEQIKAALENGTGKPAYTVEVRDPAVLDVNRNKVDKYFVAGPDGAMQEAKGVATFTAVSSKTERVYKNEIMNEATYNKDTKKWEHNGQPLDAEQTRYENVPKALQVYVRDADKNIVMGEDGKPLLQDAVRNQRNEKGQFLFVEAKDKDGNPVLDADGKQKFEPLKTKIAAEPTVFNNLSAAMNYATAVANNPEFTVNGVEHKAITMGDAFKVMNGKEGFRNTPQVEKSVEKSKSIDITD